jgi:cytochrome c-type protein NapB
MNKGCLEMTMKKSGTAGGPQMKKRPLMILTGVFTLLVITAQADPGDGVQSMRGANPINQASSTQDHPALKTDRTPVSRNFEQQPPLIPHPTKAYKINQEQNKCLSCHGLDKYEEKEATRISHSHYKDRDGAELAHVSGARYFCTMCHVEQFDVSPLVENDYEAATASD